MTMDETPETTTTTTTTTTTYDGLPLEDHPLAPPPPRNNKRAGTIETSTIATILPSSVTGVLECAQHEITTLLAKIDDNNNNNKTTTTTTTTKATGDSCPLTKEEEDALDDGFMMCDVNVVRSKLYAWHKLFPRVKPYFAMKCNPDINVSTVLGTEIPNPAGFDCASLTEVRLAASVIEQRTKKQQQETTTTTTTAAAAAIPLDITQIIYAHPQRAEHDLEQALSMGVTALTFDGPEELYKIRAAYDRLCAKAVAATTEPTATTTVPPKPQMVLRILVPDQGSAIPLGEKFGAPPSRVQPLTELALRLDLPVIGISFHCGSGCHDPSNFAAALRLAHDAMTIVNQTTWNMQTETKEDNGENTNNNNDGQGQPCWLIDMGGGYPGSDGIGGDSERFSSIPTTLVQPDNTNSNEDDEHEETAKNIAKVVVPLLDELFPRDKVTIIAEPGRYFVEGAFALVSRIYKLSVEQLNDGGQRFHYTIAYGVEGVFKDVLLCGESFHPKPLLDPENSNNKGKQILSDAPLYPSTIHGPSGDPFDIVAADCLLPQLSIGDWFVFDRMGAYTLSIASYGGRPITRYVEGGGRD